MGLKKNIVYSMTEGDWISSTIVIRIDKINKTYYFRDITTTFDWEQHIDTKTTLDTFEWYRSFDDLKTLNIKILGTKDEYPEYFL